MSGFSDQYLNRVGHLSITRCILNHICSKYSCQHLLVGEARIGLATSALSAQRSTTELLSDNGRDEWSCTNVT